MSLPPKPATTSRTGPAGTNARGDATRERLIIVAERLFAERGIAAVTFMDISRAAGQRNNVAIPYHFGDRDGLVGAITRYRAQPSEELRSRLLADLLDQPDRVTVRDIVSIMVRPLLIHFQPDNHNLGFLSHVLVERGRFPAAIGEGPMTMTRAFLTRRLPVPESVALLRIDIAMKTMVHTLARYQELQREGQLPAPLDDLFEDLITFLTAGLEAPPAARLIADEDD